MQGLYSMTTPTQTPSSPYPVASPLIPSFHNTRHEYVKVALTSSKNLSAAMDTLSNIDNILRNKNIRRSYWKIGHLLNPVTSAWLSKVDIPDISSHARPVPVDSKSWTGPWKTIMNPEDIAKVIIEMNRKQYHQAHGTPFGSGILANMVGHAGDSPITETLLAGEMHPLPQDILPESRHVLQTLATPYPMTTGTRQIEEEEFMASYRIAKEST